MYIVYSLYSICACVWGGGDFETTTGNTSCPRKYFFREKGGETRTLLFGALPLSQLSWLGSITHIHSKARHTYMYTKSEEENATVCALVMTGFYSSIGW